MKDFYAKELTRLNIFGDYEYTYGMVITNPFAYAINGEDAIINFYPVKINKTGNGIEVTNLNEVKDWTLDKHGFNIIRDENTEFSVCNASIETAYSSRGSIKVSMEYHEDPYITYNSNVSVDTGTFAGFVHTYLTKRSEGFVSSEFHPEGYNLNLGDHIEITNRLTAAAMAKDMSFKDTEPCYAVMTILFLRGYDLPIARIFYNNNQEEQDNCILICINNIADVFESMSWQASLDTSKASMRIDESVKIKKHTQEVKQQTSFDQTIEFNFLAPMYSFGDADQNKLKELNYGVEYVTFDKEDDTVLTSYKDNITGLYADCNSCYQLTMDKKTVALLYDLKSNEDTCTYPCAVLDPSCNKQYRFHSHKDESGITFMYFYDDVNDQFLYTDPVNIVFFKIEDDEVIPTKYVSKIDNLDRIFIRNIYGIPVFFKNPNKK